MYWWHFSGNLRQFDSKAHALAKHESFVTVEMSDTWKLSILQLLKWLKNQSFETIITSGN